MKEFLENLPEWAKLIPSFLGLAYLIFCMAMVTNWKQNAKDNPTPYDKIKRNGNSNY